MDIARCVVNKTTTPLYNDEI